jgi:hypothetical protein
MGILGAFAKLNLPKKLEKHPVFIKNRVLLVVSEAGFEPTTFGL